MRFRVEINNIKKDEFAIIGIMNQVKYDRVITSLISNDI
jgi:hypothetical protein